MPIFATQAMASNDAVARFNNAVQKHYPGATVANFDAQQNLWLNTKDGQRIMADPNIFNAKTPWYGTAMKALVIGSLAAATGGAALSALAPGTAASLGLGSTFAPATYGAGSAATGAGATAGIAGGANVIPASGSTLGGGSAVAPVAAGSEVAPAAAGGVWTGAPLATENVVVTGPLAAAGGAGGATGGGLSPAALAALGVGGGAGIAAGGGFSAASQSPVAIDGGSGGSGWLSGANLASGLSAAGSIGSALISSKAASDAAKATTEAANTATAEQRRQFDISRQDQQPWLTTGGSALNKLAGLYGLDTYTNPPPGAPGGPQGTQPQTGTFAPGSSQPGTDPNASFWQSPDYQFRLTQGIKGVDAGASARGSLDSGATRKAEIGYAGNLASGEYGNYANRLAALAGVGQTTATNLGQLGANYATNVGNNAKWAGDNLASSYLAKGQNYGNTISNLAGIGSGLLVNNSYPQARTPPYVPTATGSNINNWMGG